jgi:hypothetical protein
MQQVLAELRQAGNLDPATQQKFIEDLQQADPSLWPLMVQQFRAQIAYRQRLEQGRAASEPATAQAGAPQAAAPQVATAQAAAAQPVPAAQAAAPSATEPRTAAPATAVVQAAATSPAAPAPGAQGVVKAAYESPSGDNWQSHLSAAIRAREAELQAAGKGPDDAQAQAQLRMLYLLAGRRDDALKPISAASPALQGFWTSEVYGISAWLDAHRIPDEQRRSTEARQYLAEAVTRLGESCPLVVRSLAFCTEIQSYGCIKAFEHCEFTPGQPVLLYAELENLSSESTPKGIHTSLQSSYQIFDGRGQRVADEEFTVTEEYCRNPRRDYFIGYELRIPERIYPGKHTLQLTVRDTRSQKIGQATIDFTVKKK